MKPTCVNAASWLDTYMFVSLSSTLGTTHTFESPCENAPDLQSVLPPLDTANTRSFRDMSVNDIRSGVWLALLNAMIFF